MEDMLEPGSFRRETKRPYIRALQRATRGCLKKTTAMRPNAIFFCCTVALSPKAMDSFSLVSFFRVIRMQ